MRLRAALWAGCAIAIANTASAQTFDQAIVFGDSSMDSGFYKQLASPGASATYNSYWAAAVAAGAGAPTTSPGLMNSQDLAAEFGLSALPANQPGGTNFATSGAKNVVSNDAQTGGFTAAIPVVTQIANYLASNGGNANPNALYLVGSGGNVVSFALGDFGTGPFPADPSAFITGEASSLAASIVELKAAGARYFIVVGQPYSFPLGDTTQQQARLLYTQSIWSDLAKAGVNFIPADFNALRLAINANPLAFGFTSISNAPGSTACTVPAGVTSSWALLCSSNPAAPSHLVSPNAEQTFLFADDQHLTTAGQKAEADYYYGLIVAPSEISLLPETTVKTRTETVRVIQQQIGTTERQHSPLGLNVWATGDIANLSFTNAPGFPGDPGDALSGTFGGSFTWPSGFQLGAAITFGSDNPSFDLGGDFTDQDVSGSLYGGFRIEPFWGDLIATYGGQNYDINRMVPIGITTQNNHGSTSGSDLSLAIEGGYDFNTAGVTHGPVVGITLQHVKVDGFTEGGSFTSESFADQTRDSAVSALGYQASVDIGNWSPFAEVVWDHEWASTDQSVTASLTTISAPSYFMPAIDVGTDWGTATAGVRLKLNSNLSALASFSGQFGQSGATVYGGLLGLNASF